MLENAVSLRCYFIQINPILFCLSDHHLEMKFQAKSGKPIQDDYRRIIIGKILAEGGDRCTGYIPVAKSRLAESLCVSVFTINKTWQRFMVLVCHL